MRLSRRPVALSAAALAVAAALTSCAGSPAAPPAASTAAPAPKGTTIAEASADSCPAGAVAAVAAARRKGFPLGSATLTDAAKAAGGRAVLLPAATTSLTDFLAGDERIDAARIGTAAAGLVGAGSDRSVVTMTPHSSTRKSVVPTTEYEINPLNVLRISSRRPVVGGFTLTGTPQGHTYNGLRIERSAGARVGDVKIVGVPGDMDRPPGETFGINDYKTVGSRYEHIDIDGAGVGAAGFAANVSKDVRVCGVTSHDNTISMGFAFWSVTDATLIDCTAIDNGFAGFNFERVSGTVRLVNPVARHNRWDMRVVSDVSSAKYTIVDPDLSQTQVPGKWTVEVPGTYWKHKGKQRISDIHLIVDGRERPDLLRIVQPY